MKLPKVELNAPVTVTFSIISFVVLLFGYATLGESTKALFTCYRSVPSDPLMYIRMFTYIFGHKDITHFVNNFTTIILIGPMLEEKYGSKPLVLMILVTAFVGGLANILFTANGILGASGVVFMFIILCSCTSVSSGKIPLTLVLVVVIYIGQEILTGVTTADNISHSTHILGGLCGIGFGLYYNRENPKQ